MSVCQTVTSIMQYVLVFITYCSSFWSLVIFLNACIIYKQFIECVCVQNILRKMLGQWHRLHDLSTLYHRAALIQCLEPNAYNLFLLALFSFIMY